MSNHLKQARIIISTAWQRNLTFRFTTMTYRIGEIAEVLVLILMWSAIYATGSGAIKGFTLNEMITYVLIGNLASTAVRNFLPSYISRDINEGRLSMFLVKPISYIKFVFINELGRILFATLISLGSIVAVIFFFLDKIYINTQSSYIFLILAMMFLSFVIELLIGFLIGCIAFWTEEVDGIQMTIERIKRFFSGGYFPLSLLPISLITTSNYLPFQYSFFIPASIYLKKMSLSDGVRGLGIQLIWIVLLSLILHFVWKRGLRKYEATGS